MTKVVSILFMAVVFMAISIFVWSLDIEDSSPPTIEGVSLLIEPYDTIVNLNSNRYVRIDATIINQSASSLKIVQPSDGSQFGWRTPIMKWSVREVVDKVDTINANDFLLYNGLRCGNINSVNIEELISLDADDEVQLDAKFGYPAIPKKVGKYSIRLLYTNAPKMRWKGLGFHDRDIMRQVRKTDNVELISNHIVVEVIE